MSDYELDDSGKSYIMIDDTTRLTITPRNWQLQKKQIAGEKSKEAGQVTWTAFRYYVSLQSALNDVIHIKLSNESFKDVRGMVEAYEKAVKELADALYPDYKLVAA